MFPIHSNSNLAPYQEALTQQTAAHLLRRATVAPTKADINALVGQNAATVVANLLADAQNRPLPADLSWYNTGYPPTGSDQATIDTYNAANTTWKTEFRYNGLRELGNGALAERMTLFWHNHFVTELQDVSHTTFMARYVKAIRLNAFGDFKAFVKAMTLDMAMLNYLNGVQSTRTSPNENYARELLELFTMGIGNYTQTDITEAARALTGWRTDRVLLNSYFTTSRFDANNKTVFGQTGNWNADTLIDVIFQQRATEIATFICTKLYKQFAYAVPNETIVAQLATTFIQNNFQIAPVLLQLLSSQHFFDVAFHGAKIKSPFELLIGLIRNLQPANTEALHLKFTNEQTLKMGQYIWDPPNVAGWEEHQTWLTATTLAVRWDACTKLVNGVTSGNTRMVVYNPVPFAKTFATPQNVYELAFDIAQFFTAIPLDVNLKTALGDRLLAGIPYYEWDVDSTGAPAKLRTFLIYLFKLPEFQLS